MGGVGGTLVDGIRSFFHRCNSINSHIHHHKNKKKNKNKNNNNINNIVFVRHLRAQLANVPTQQTFDVLFRQLLDINIPLELEF